MKFYETHYEDYIHSMKKINLHKELEPIIENLPKRIKDFGNMIVYGPRGIGKYTQVLNMIKRYSANELKHDTKMTCQTDKVQYTYHISDIHYEIDMSLLGCNSKLLWHEIFFQIVDIITVKQNKRGIILCKNFHCIHTELLEIFYSYIQHFNYPNSQLQIHFILLTEQVSFIPNNIINSCVMLRIGRPDIVSYKKILTKNTDFLETIDIDGIVNIKELHSLHLIKPENNAPVDIFNTICDDLIKEILNYNEIVFTSFRDNIYDILIYDIDVAECLWYILNYLIEKQHLKDEDVSPIFNKTYVFLKYYNNNYRPIYHLESILFYLIIKVHNIKEV